MAVNVLTVVVNEQREQKKGGRGGQWEKKRNMVLSCDIMACPPSMDFGRTEVCRTYENFAMQALAPFHIH